MGEVEGGKSGEEVEDNVVVEHVVRVRVEALEVEGREEGSDFGGDEGCEGYSISVWRRRELYGNTYSADAPS